MKYLLFCNFLIIAKKSIDKQLNILKLSHTWIMTYLYIMTFGSFIGFSTSFPKLIKDLFPDTNPLSLFCNLFFFFFNVYFLYNVCCFVFFYVIL